MPSIKNNELRAGNINQIGKKWNARYTGRRERKIRKIMHEIIRNKTLFGILWILVIPITASGTIASNKKWCSRVPNNPISKNVVKKVKSKIDRCFLFRSIFVMYKNPPIAGIIPNNGRRGNMDKVS